jgi:hypothetical protein
VEHDTGTSLTNVSEHSFPTIVHMVISHTYVISLLCEFKAHFSPTVLQYHDTWDNLVSGLCLSSGSLKKTNVGKVDLFPFSGEGRGGPYAQRLSLSDLLAFAVVNYRS